MQGCTLARTDKRLKIFIFKEQYLYIMCLNISTTLFELSTDCTKQLLIYSTPGKAVCVQAFLFPSQFIFLPFSSKLKKKKKNLV